MSYDELRTALIERISDLLLQKGLATIGPADYFLWAWSTDILLHIPPPEDLCPVYIDDSNEVDQEIRKLFFLGVNSALATLFVPPKDKNEWRANADVRLAYDKIWYRAHPYLINSNLAFCYLVFPLLEAVLRRACSVYVDSEGTVLTPFSVPKGTLSPSVDNKLQGPFTKDYAPNGRNDKCSSLQDYLLLLHNDISTQTLRDDLTSYRAHLSLIDSSQDPYKTIYHWRNSTLHGARNHEEIGGILLNLILLIALDSYSIHYNLKQRIEVENLEAMRRFGQTHSRSLWWFYPPLPPLLPGIVGPMSYISTGN